MPDENTIENAPVETPNDEKVKKAPVSKQFTVPMPLVPQVEKMIGEYRAKEKAKIDAARNAKKREAAQEKLRKAQAELAALQGELPSEPDNAL